MFFFHIPTLILKKLYNLFNIIYHLVNKIPQKLDNFKQHFIKNIYNIFNKQQVFIGNRRFLSD